MAGLGANCVRVLRKRARGAAITGLCAKVRDHRRGQEHNHIPALGTKPLLAGVRFVLGKHLLPVGFGVSAGCDTIDCADAIGKRSCIDIRRGCGRNNVCAIIGINAQRGRNRLRKRGLQGAQCGFGLRYFATVAVGRKTSPEPTFFRLVWQPQTCP